MPVTVPDDPAKQHWEQVYATKRPDAVSWHQQHAAVSLAMVRQSGIALAGSIIDVGGGASVLADDLLDAGFRNLHVLDISGAALAAARKRLGPERSSRVQWIESDISASSLPAHAFDLWHDRAVFHFLVEAEQRARYLAAATRAIRPGGHLIIATFAEDGPVRCSGLPVVRYRPQELQGEFGGMFMLLRHERETHVTPSGALQQFLYCHFKKLH